MIQDIFPNRLDNQYVECSPQDNDVIFFFEGFITSCEVY